MRNLFRVGSCTFCTESTEVVNLVGGDPKLKEKADERQTIQIDSIDWFSSFWALLGSHDSLEVPGTNGRHLKLRSISVSSTNSFTCHESTD